MQPLSRRQFLQLMGIGLASSQIRLFDHLFPATIQVYYGRALEALPLYSESNGQGKPLTYLWPDSVIPLFDVRGDRYRVEGGYVRREGLQPMILSEPDESNPIPDHSWMEVAGPVAAVRRWCAPDAPLVTRIGHGGIVQVIDRLPGETLWYGIASETGDLLGWSQAAHWKPVIIVQSPAGKKSLEINPRMQTLVAVENDQVILTAPISTGTIIPSGAYSIQGRQIGDAQCSLESGASVYYGLPSTMVFGKPENNYQLAGVYWHNRFGAPAPGPAVQVSTMIARWLYMWLDDASQIIIR